MKIANFAVKHPQFTIVVFGMLAALGVHAFLTIPRSEDPVFPIPEFAIIAVHPGATPSDMEQLVVDPIEDALHELDDVKVQRAQIRDSVAIMRIAFDASSSADTKYQDVLRQLNATRAKLPPDLHTLDVLRFASNRVVLLQAALVSTTAPASQLRALAEDLETRLEAIDGVREASIFASPRREAHLALDLEKLGRLGISLDQVFQAIGSDNTTIPGGAIEAGARRFDVLATTPYRTLPDLEATVVGGGPGGVVHLADVADVAWGTERQEIFGRFDGQPAVFVNATLKDGQNVFTVRDRLSTAIDTFAKTLPTGVTLQRGFDQSKNVAHRLDRLYEDFGLAILLVLITLLPLGLRASLVVMVSIPLSLAIGLALLKLFGFGLNQLSIVGFVISLGLLVDDSIVVVENITRHLREGMSRTDAAIAATKQIGVAVLGCTAALVFAFVPLLFLPGSAGDFIRSLPMAVILTILSSLFVSLTIVPFLASRVLARTAHENVALRVLDKGIHLSYARLLGAALAKPKTTVAAAALLFAGSLALIPAVGFSLFPKAGIPQFMVSIETPEGSSLEDTDRVTRAVEGVLHGHPEIEWVTTSVGEGLPSIYYNVLGKARGANGAEVIAQLKTFDPKTSPVLYDRIRDELAAIPGARVELKEFENGPPIDAPIAIRLLGDDLEQLRIAATRVAAVVEATPGTRYVHDPLKVRRADLRVAVDRAKAGVLGVPAARIGRAVRLGVAGLGLGTMRLASGEDVALVATLAQAARADLDALDRIVVESVTGAAIPLAQLASLELEAAPSGIQHHDRERATTVTAHVESGANTDRVTKKILAELAKVDLPDGVRWVAAGEIESRQESFGGLGAAILVAVFGILAILVLEFGSFRGTIVVASVIPLGIVGGIGLLFATGYTLSFTSVIGFIALVGIEIKNSILLVDFTDQLRRDGMSVDAAIQRAGEIRFLPIVLTTMTAIGGLLPLAWQGSGLYSPLAVVLVGGLISSTLLARLVTPVMYKLLAPAEVAS